ncbi:MAG: hypothetical protein EAY66_04100 [Sphingobacteriales bacterium]|nr:MAG: hypothetical protein EAY66_04100 [Sphingobacteriales bacterium]
MPKKNLITAANNPLAYQLAWYIKNQEIHFCDNAQHQHIIPAYSSSSFAHQFLKYCLTHNIDRVFALKVQEIAALAESEILFKEFGIELMLVQPAVLQHIKSIIKSNAVIEVNNFSAFSAAVLKVGYPEKIVWWGRADLSGQFYQLNDTHNANILWNKEGILSFLQASKLLQQSEFTPLYIYPNKPMLVKALCINGAVFYGSEISESTDLVFKNLQVKFNLKGFFELTLLDGKLFFFKTLTT